MQFISISEVLQAIASEVEVQADWLDDLLKLSRIPDTQTLFGREFATFGLFGRSGYRAQFVRSFRLSEAAARLDAALHNAATKEAGPTWFDKRETNHAKISPRAREAYLPVLVDLASHFSRLIQAHREGRLDLTGRTRPPHCDWEGFSPELRDLIGFDRGEIFGFLTFSKIVFAERASSNASVEQTITGDDSDEAASAQIIEPVALLPMDEVSVDEGNTASKLPGEPEPSTPLPRQRDPVSFDELYEMELATTLLNIPQNFRDVAAKRRFVREALWLRLTTISRKIAKPDFLKGFVERKGIEYLDGDDWSHYTSGAHSKRIYRLFKEEGISKQDQSSSGRVPLRQTQSGQRRPSADKGGQGRTTEDKA